MRVLINAFSDVWLPGENIKFFIEDFPERLHKGDLIDLVSMFNEEGLSNNQIEQIYSLIWDVEDVQWGKDEKGIYLMAYCHGE